jgi:hypothetical protein
MTSGSSLEIVGLPRSVGGFHGIRAFSEVFQALSLSLPQALHGSEVNGPRVSSWRGCLARSLLGDDIFPRGGMRRTG